MHARKHIGSLIIFNDKNNDYLKSGINFIELEYQKSKKIIKQKKFPFRSLSYDRNSQLILLKQNNQILYFDIKTLQQVVYPKLLAGNKSFLLQGEGLS